MKLTKLLSAIIISLAFFACSKDNNTTGGGGGTANNPLPVAISMSPTAATAGDPSFTLTVSGSGFINGSTIRWNSVALVTSYVSPGQLTAIVPAANIAIAGTADVSVFTTTPGGGTSSSLTFTISNVVVNNPVPVTASISPNTAIAGGAAFTLTVNGSNFVNGSVVKWNGALLTTTFINPTQLTATVAATDIAVAGTIAVTVFTPLPGGGTSAPQNFVITPNNPLPALTTLSPNNATAGSGAFTLTANGTNFISGSTINWNGTPLTTTFVSASQLTATVPASNITTAGTASVTVFTPLPGGGTSNALTFTINSTNPLPALTSLAPNTATAGAGSFTMVANGSNFVTTSVIKWNGASLATTFISATQLSAVVPAINIATAGTATVTVFSPTPGGGTSNGLIFTINAPSSIKKFLFDATHAETAGNADWVIDEDGSVPQRIPTPAQSTVNGTTPETYWTGALSSWGIALAQQGYTVETLPLGTSITYGNGANAQDLSNYDVFVVDEPNKVFTAAEKTAILNFVNNGGGLFMVSDHTGSDRDGDGWDSPAIWNDLMSNNTVQTNPFGFTIDLANFSDISSNVLTGGGSPILSGTQGNVTQIQFNNGTSTTLNPAVNPTVKGLIWKTGAAQNNNNVISLSSTFGTGRMYFVGDSSPIDDGTGAPGNTLFPDWLNYSHKSLFMNASLWLAKIQ